MKKIKLGGKLGEGIFALVSDCDFKAINKYSWCIAKTSTTKNTGYVVTNVRTGECWPNGKNKYKTVYLHKIVWDLMVIDGIQKPLKKDYVIDHINTNSIRINNQRENLRMATQTLNLANFKGYAKSKPYINKKYIKSNAKGVYGLRGKNNIINWYASISILSQHVYLNQFYKQPYTEQQAILAYNVAALIMYGDYANKEKMLSKDKLLLIKTKLKNNNKYGLLVK